MDVVPHPAVRRRGPGLAVMALALGLASQLASAEIHRCPRPDGTMEFRDRPCAAGPAESAAAPPTEPASNATPSAARKSRRAAHPQDAASGAAAPAANALPVPIYVSPAFPTSGGEATDDAERTGGAPAAEASRSRRVALPPAASAASTPPPTTRAAYVARNEVLCREGDRRACAAVTCDRSGDLASPACQEAVGYVRGPGWDLRPSGDLFDAARLRDDYLLTCRSTGRRAALSRSRGSDIFDWPGGPVQTVARAELAAAARNFCGTR